MKIACVHQGYELYGSDRAFVESVRAIRDSWPNAEIEVVLPRDGPIVSHLTPAATRIVFEPLWVLRRRRLLRLATFDLARLPLATYRAIQRFRRFDLVYINTAVILDYAVAARLNRARALWHVHEIPEGIALRILRCMVRWSGAEMIFNSQATKAAYGLPADSVSHVIYNGVAGPEHPEPVSYAGQRPLRVAMLGRINRIKGQEILAAAVAMLPPDLRDRIEVRMIGGAFENDALERELAAMIATSGLAGRITLEPFTHDAAAVYRWADIVVSPSQRPESLGRVAIEALSYGRPVIASAIGGLAEVVEDGVCGWLTPPGQTRPLSDQLAAIIARPEKWRGFAAAARARYEALFREEIAARALGDVVRAKFERAGRAKSAQMRLTAFGGAA